MKSLKVRRIVSNTLIYIILIAMSIIWLLPVVWLVLQSFGKGGIELKQQLIPKEFSFDNYLYLFNNITGKVNPLASNTSLDGKFLTWFVFMKFNLVIGMFPGFLGMIIMYWVMKEIFNLQGNYFALVIIYSAGAGGGYYISKGFFDTISKNIDEAAMVDGASKSQIFWQIILPLAKPIIVYTILTSFMGPWGDYITICFRFSGYCNIILHSICTGCSMCCITNYNIVLLLTKVLCIWCNWWSSERIKLIYEKEKNNSNIILSFFIIIDGCL